MMTDPRRSWQRFRSLTRCSLVNVGATGGRQLTANARMVRAVPGAAASEARHAPAEDPVRGGDDPPVVRPPRAKPRVAPRRSTTRPPAPRCGRTKRQQRDAHEAGSALGASPKGRLRASVVARTIGAKRDSHPRNSHAYALAQVNPPQPDGASTGSGDSARRLTTAPQCERDLKEVPGGS